MNTKGFCWFLVFFLSHVVLAQKKCSLLVWLKPDCPVCQKVAPELRKTLEKHQEIDAKFFLVNCSAREAKRFLAQNRLNASKWVLDKEHFFAQKFEVRVSPDFLVFDSDSVLVYRGPLNDAFPQLGTFLEPTTNYVSEAVEGLRASKNFVPIFRTPVGCVFR